MSKIFERPNSDIIGVLVFLVLLVAGLSGHIVTALLILFPLVLLYNYMLIRSIEEGKIKPPKTFELVEKLFWKSFMVKFNKFSLLLLLISYIGFVVVVVKNVFG